MLISLKLGSPKDTAAEAFSLAIAGIVAADADVAVVAAMLNCSMPLWLLQLSLQSVVLPLLEAAATETTAAAAITLAPLLGD